MDMITAVIVEDSELARFELKHLLQAFPQIDVLDEAWNVSSAIKTIDELQPQLVFMDIDLPGGNAFDVLAGLSLVPKLIFTTAFDQFALQAFDHDTVDYLLKPIKAERLGKAVNKLLLDTREVTPTAQAATSPLSLQQSIFVKDGERCKLIKCADISHIEALGNYSRVFFNNQVITHSSSLASIENKLDENYFFKISRSCIVQLSCITEIEHWVTGGYQITLTQGQKLEVSRRQAAKFKQQLLL